MLEAALVPVVVCTALGYPGTIARFNPSRKSGGQLDAHFGLGKATIADVKVTLPSGRTATFAGVKANQFLDLNVTTSQSTPVIKESKP